jgi:hypothetical protein
VTDILRQGTPSVHEHEFNGRLIRRYVPLTHSASSLTRAPVMTSVISDEFMIGQVKGGELTRTNMIDVLVGGAEDAFFWHNVCCRDTVVCRERLLGSVGSRAVQRLCHCR